ncbi:MAG: cadherin domain-containing protein [Chloroflexi bacterium]|nr:cadherin domain-containing protein [Chloroflexota bacterium]
MNDIVDRFGRAMVAAAALTLIVAALLAIAPSGVDATSVVAATNSSPTFNEGASTTRSVSEDATIGQAIGDPVSATDADGDMLFYDFVGHDHSIFTIEPTSGQLSTSVNLNLQAGRSFTVVVRVDDNKNADGNPDPTIDARITVMINVVTPGTLQQSGGSLGFGPAPVAPKFDDGIRTEREVFENAAAGDPAGDPVTATHQDGLAITYFLSGTDAASFTVDEDTGQLRVKEGAALVLDRTFTVNLTATDSAGIGAIIIVDIVVVETPYHEYDTNQNGRIDRDEVLAAVSDYFAGDIDKEKVIELVRLYYQDA